MVLFKFLILPVLFMCAVDFIYLETGDIQVGNVQDGWLDLGENSRPEGRVADASSAQYEHFSLSNVIKQFRDNPNNGTFGSYLDEEAGLLRDGAKRYASR